MVSRKRRPVEEPPQPAPKEKARAPVDGAALSPDGNGAQEDESEPSSCVPSPSQFTIRPIIRPKPGPVEITEKKKRKKKKKKAAVGDEDEDEIALLREMARVRAETGSDPSSDPGVLVGLAKWAGIPREEAVEKVKSLKRKYFKNVDRGGEEKLFKKPRELEVFQLSKKVWGPPESEPPRGGSDVGGGDNGGVVLAPEPLRGGGDVGGCDNGGVVLALPVSADVGVRSGSRRGKRAGNPRKGRVVVVEEEEVKGGELVVAAEEVEEGKVSWKEEFPLSAGWLEGECGGYLGEGGVRALEEWMENVGRGKMSEWEGKWRELKVEELRLFLRRQDLISEQVKFVVDGIKSSK